MGSRDLSAEIVYPAVAGQTDQAVPETELDIETLVSRAQRGDRSAMGAIYRQYVKTVYKYLSYRLRNTAAAEDLTAEVFLRVLRKIESFEWRGIDFSAWILRIARNVLLDYVKSSGNRFEIVGIPAGEIPEATSPGSDLQVLDELDKEALHKALNLLRPEHQEVLYLRFLQGLSSTEVAKVMGRTEGAIRVLQFRALKQLVKVMKTTNPE